MRYSICLSEQAEQDLRGIFSYIAFSLRSLQHAAEQLERLEQSIAKLNEMPERFRAYEKEPWHSRGLCVMPVDHYLVFYIPNPETRMITVIRVMYGGRDVDMRLLPSTG